MCLLVPDQLAACPAQSYCHGGHQHVLTGALELLHVSCPADEEEGEEASDQSGEEEEEEEGDAGAKGGRRSGRGRRRKHGGSRRAEFEIVQINKRTSKASQQEQEMLDGPEELPNMKPMMELEAGKNVWYQAYVLKESLNEAKVRFPRESDRVTRHGCYLGAVWCLTWHNTACVA